MKRESLASLGNKIKIARKEKNITSKELSSRLNLHEVSLRQMQNAMMTPSLDTFLDICNELEVSPTYLLSDSLKFKEQNRLDKLNNCVKHLTEKQLDSVIITVEALTKAMKDKN